MKPATLKLILCSMAMVLAMSGALHAGVLYNFDSNLPRENRQYIPDEYRNSALCGFTTADSNHPEYINNCRVTDWRFLPIRVDVLSANFRKNISCNLFSDARKTLINTLHNTLRDINVRIDSDAYGDLRIDDSITPLPSVKNGFEHRLGDYIQFSQSWEISNRGRYDARLPRLKVRKDIKEVLCRSTAYSLTPEQNVACRPASAFHKNPESVINLKKTFDSVQLSVPAQGVNRYLDSQIQELASLLLRAHKIADEELERKITRFAKNIILAAPFKGENEKTALLFLNLIREALYMPLLDLSKVGHNLLELSVEEFVGKRKKIVWVKPAEPLVDIKESASIQMGTVGTVGTDSGQVSDKVLADKRSVDKIAEPSVGLTSQLVSVTERKVIETMDRTTNPTSTQGSSKSKVPDADAAVKVESTRSRTRQEPSRKKPWYSEALNKLQSYSLL